MLSTLYSSPTVPLSRCHTKNLWTWSGSLTSTEAVGPISPSLNTPCPAGHSTKSLALLTVQPVVSGSIPL